LQPSIILNNPYYQLGSAMLNQSYIQVQKQSLRPLTTAHIAQTMSLLLLNGQELKQKIENELSSNPALEVVQNYPCPTCGRLFPRNRSCPVCSHNSEVNDNSAIIFVSPRSDFYGVKKSSSDETYDPEEYMVSSEDLHTYVFRQIAPDINQEDIPIAKHILSSLDKDGLLEQSDVEIAQYHHTSLSRVNNILSIIQRVDPIGVASRSPKEALLVQLDVLSENYEVPPLAKSIVSDQLELLSRHSYTEIGRIYGVPSQEIMATGKFIIDNLNPFPARTHWGNQRTEPHSNQTYQNPDVIITETSKPTKKFIIEIVSPYSGQLKINSLYLEAIKNAPKEKAEKWQKDLEHAGLLIKCIKQRNNTLVRFMRLIVDLQRNFILNGDTHLKPITRSYIADELNVHESTISRTVAGKTIQLPNKKIIPISKLFDRSLCIRAEIRKIINEENNPLSDSKISTLLNERGYNVARRTVAKYRSIEGILPARLRQNTINPTQI